MINQPDANAPLLCPLETAVVPATIEPFNIRDRNIKRAAGIKLFRQSGHHIYGFNSDRKLFPKLRS